MSTPTINADDLSFVALFVRDNPKSLSGTNMGRYIEKGEAEGFDKRKTCASREPARRWYDLGENINDVIAFPQRFRQKHIVFYNPHRFSLNKNLYGVQPGKPKLAKAIAIVLNSTWVSFCLEIIARQPGGGGGPLDVDVNVAGKILVPNLNRLEKYREKIEAIDLLDRGIGTIFDELGAVSPSEVSFETVRKDRLELDRIVLQDILGISEEDHLEVYRAVIDLVSSRLARAKSVQKPKKKKAGSVADAMTDNLAEEFFYDD